MMRAACAQHSHSNGLAVALGLAACGFGEEGISVSKDDPDYNGAVLFADPLLRLPHAERRRHPGHRQPRASAPRGRTSTERTETYEDALFAIQNGGFSGAIMPQNIVVGEEAEEVARFVAKYAGQEAEESPRPGESFALSRWPPDARPEADPLRP